MDLAKQVAQILLKIEAVKVKIDPPFKWASGILSPIYCDNRLLISYPEEREVIVNGFVETIKEKGLNPDIIAGTATAAIPWAAFVAQKMNLPMIYIRSEKKEHGAGRQIEGKIEAGRKVVIIEDLISTGGSSIKAAEAVKEEGKSEVTDILAIVTWELKKAVDRFAAANLNLTTLTNYTNIIQTASEEGYLSEEQKEKVLEFKIDPPAWGSKMGLE